MWNSECGMGNGEKKMAECLIFKFSAFRIPTSEFRIPLTAYPLKLFPQKKGVGCFDFSSQIGIPVG